MLLPLIVIDVSNIGDIIITNIIGDAKILNSRPWMTLDHTYTQVFENFVADDFEILQGNSDFIKTTVVCPAYINTGMFDGVQVLLKKNTPASPKAGP